MDGAVPTLERDGLKFGATPFSNDPLRAVQGNAAAEEHARTYLWRSRVGLGLVAVGMAMVITGALLLRIPCWISRTKPQTSSFVAPCPMAIQPFLACCV